MRDSFECLGVKFSRCWHSRYWQSRLASRWGVTVEEIPVFDSLGNKVFCRGQAFRAGVQVVVQGKSPWHAAHRLLRIVMTEEEKDDFWQELTAKQNNVNLELTVKLREAARQTHLEFMDKLILQAMGRPFMPPPAQQFTPMAHEFDGGLNYFEIPKKGSRWRETIRKCGSLAQRCWRSAKRLVTFSFK